MQVSLWILELQFPHTFIHIYIYIHVYIFYYHLNIFTFCIATIFFLQRLMEFKIMFDLYQMGGDI